MGNEMVMTYNGMSIAKASRKSSNGHANASTESTTTAGTTSTVQPGWYACLMLRPGYAPKRFYGGKVDAVDEHGLRLGAADFDLFVPWGAIALALVHRSEGDDGPDRSKFNDEALA